MIGLQLQSYHQTSIVTRCRFSNAYEQGDFEEANNVLNINEIASDCSANIKLLKEARLMVATAESALHVNLQELKIKFSLLLLNPIPNNEIKKRSECRENIKQCIAKIEEIQIALNVPKDEIYGTKIELLNDCFVSYLFAPGSPMFDVNNLIDEISNAEIELTRKHVLLADYIHLLAKSYIGQNNLRSRNNKPLKYEIRTIKELLNKSIQYYKESGGTHKLQIGYLYSNLAGLLFTFLDNNEASQNDWNEIIQLGKSALEIKKEFLPHNHPDVINEYNSIATYLYYKGETEACVNNFKQAADLSTTVDSNLRERDIYHWSILNTQCLKDNNGLYLWNYAQSLAVNGEFEQAIKIFIDNIERCYYRFDVYNKIGGFYARLENYKDALKYFVLAKKEYRQNNKELSSFGDYTLAGNIDILACLIVLQRRDDFIKELKELTEISDMYFANERKSKSFFRWTKPDLKYEYIYNPNDFVLPEDLAQHENGVFAFILESISSLLAKKEISKYSYVVCVFLLCRWAYDNNMQLEYEKCCIIFKRWFDELKNKKEDYKELQQAAVKVIFDLQVPIVFEDVLSSMGIKDFSFKKNGHVKSSTVTYLSGNEQ